MFASRRSVIPFGALITAAALGAGLLAAKVADPGSPASRISPQYVALQPRPAAGLLPISSVSAGLSTRLPDDQIGTAPGPVTVRYTFDGGVNQPVTDTDGANLLQPLGQNGGTLSLVPQGSGLAVEYPSRCALTRDRGQCPRAILEGFRDDTLNPGTRPMQYGAAVKMNHGDLSDGANVFQKGYSVGRVSQFKLQVDHRRGHPSCVVASLNKIYRAEPDLDVADGRWHNLACIRTADTLSMAVDGLERASVPVPTTLSIANAEPLRIGGKGPNKGNDQFAGLIDNVFLTIG